MNIIETNALTKYYGKARGITDVYLDIPEGDFFGFIGPNGAGKSTTIRILLGLLSPTDGTAKVFGKDVWQKKEEILSDIGYMPSEAVFYGGMKVREVIAFSAKMRGTDCSHEAGILCDRLELDTEKKIRELSFGNRKKVSVVCALQHKPGLCILDEPTSGLDPLMQKEFFDILEERNAAGMTIFLSSHILSEVQRHCRHAAVIREGKILASGNMEELGKKQAKRVSVKGTAVLPELDGIKDVAVHGDTMNFLYNGETKKLLLALSGLPLTDVNITEPDLEEIFMHYYREETD